MKAQRFKIKADSLINKLYQLIEIMPDKGDSVFTSQKINLQAKLQNFSNTVNGVNDEDFINEEE